MQRAPRVSVITCVYNGMRFLAQAVESVLAQTFQDFEYIIVDDASTDETPELLAEFAQRDSRIRLIPNATNQNAAGALNVALAQTRGEYVAVLDHDDIALPARLARQSAFLDANPQLGAVGAQVKLIDENGTTLKISDSYPVESVIARWNVLFYAPLLHSASMYRRSILQTLGGYSRQHLYLCDYELLGRLAHDHAITNLPDLLACYRRSDLQISWRHAKQQTGQMLLLQLAIHKRWLGITQDLRVFPVLLDWIRLVPPASESLAEAARGCLENIWQAYVARGSHSERDMMILQQEMARRWVVLAHTVRTSLSAVSKTCLQRAIELDADVLRRSDTKTALRKVRAERRLKDQSPSEDQTQSTVEQVREETLEKQPSVDQQ